MSELPLTALCVGAGVFHDDQLADVTIDNLCPLVRSVTRTTCAFPAVTPFERRALIRYIGASDPGLAGPRLQGHVQFAAAARGVPVARTVAADDSAVALGNRSLISDMARGETDYLRIVGQLDTADRQAGSLPRLWCMATTGWETCSSTDPT